ncbi:PQQ-binding-like beta-propeller repeat protein [Haloprofundus halobius]|uniref:outer membrane protein assembly factor BamB family protein n=1 Tax=Haloprofundus halobius TaxID=2876194 RepID=UPI001CCDC34A|nr:PQQ-binding-like beta-propeller repeat protein [Haloprofundus halobius]
MNRRDLLATGSALLTAGVAGCNAPKNSDPAPDETKTVDGGAGTADGEVGTADEWPMFLYDSAHQRDFSSEGIAVEEPSVRWSSETDDAIWSSPVIADGTLYIGSYDGHLYALDADTGERLWRYRTGDRIDGSPAVANGTVFFGSFDRNVYALDADTGEQRWMYGSSGIVRSSPSVADGVVYIGTHCRTEECNAYYDVRWPERGGVYALDADTGALRWRYEAGDGVISSPAIVDGTVYVGSSDTTMAALDADTGETRWRRETGGPIMSSPVRVDDRVVFGNVSGELYSLAAADGSVQWSFDANQRGANGVQLPVVVTGTPVVVDGTAYVGAMVPGDDIRGKLYAISVADGTHEWSESPFGQAVGSSAVVVDDVVYFGSHLLESSADAESGLYAVDTDGATRWEHVVSGEDYNGFGSSPAVVGTTLYIGSTDGNVYAFDLG